MTNAEIVAQAVRNLESDMRALGVARSCFSTREIMREVGRNGYYLSTAKTRNVCRHLAKIGELDTIKDGPYYRFSSSR